MGLNTGRFTAPVNGTYYFTFSGVKNRTPSADMRILLVHQSKGNSGERVVDEVGIALTGEGADLRGSAKRSLSMSSTLRMEKGDVVYLRHLGPDPILFDQPELRMTHFTGWLIEEELFDGRRV